MDHDKRAVLYEKLYFYELERREKISARLALPFAAILATVGLLSFMLNADGRPSNQPLFWALFTASSIALLIGAWFFRLAWFGHNDKLLPTADEIENYHTKLKETYADYPDVDQLVSKHFGDFLFDYYKRDSSANAISNDRRAYNIYRANFALTIAVLFSLVTAIPFYVFRTDLGVTAMTEEKPLPPPPPPPPPPPERSVKGDVPSSSLPSAKR